VRFLLSVRNALGLLVFESTIRALCTGGDEVICVLSAPLQMRSVLDRLDNELDWLSLRAEPELGGTPDAELAAALRMTVDYLRYLEPELVHAAKYRERSGQLLPGALKMQMQTALGEAPELRRALSAGLRAVERSLPVPTPVIELLERENPDAVLVSPLLKRGSPQVAFLRAARRIGIPSALLVASWDHLTTKGVIQETPDLVTVWNEAQRVEATDLHGIPPERIAVVGAPRFDAWFDHTPNTTREEHCRRLGLPVDRPYILYVGSSRFIAPDEASWIAHWLSELRSSGQPELHDVPVLFRPHPGSPPSTQQGAEELATMPGVAIDPANGADVSDAAAMSDYYDALHHSAVVVGINTSAMIEAAVVGRGVHVIVPERYRTGQDLSPHFDHLHAPGHELVVLTHTLDEHARGLAQAIRGDDAAGAAQRAESFVSFFLRPRGLDRPATPIMVEELRRLATTPVASSAPAVEDLADELRDVVLRKRKRKAAGPPRNGLSSGDPVVGARTPSLADGSDASAKRKKAKRPRPSSVERRPKMPPGERQKPT